jgi:hypothetical protein
MKKLLFGALAMFGVTAAVSMAGAQEAAVSDGAKYTAAGQLERPVDYREWVYLTSGLGMTYGPTAPAAGQPQNFDNVFVNRQSYRSFLETGRWPEKTMFILEGRRSVENASINNGGRTQGEAAFMEAAVKDSAKYPGLTWGYFSFDGRDGLVAAAERLPESATCYKCHRENTAVEQTFVQFYPTLFDVAQRKGTVKPTYDPAHKAQ